MSLPSRPIVTSETCAFIATRVRKSRRTLTAVMAIVSALVTSHFARAQESALVFRWTTKDRHVFPAKFLRLQSTSLVVERDGFEFKVPISVLSPASLEFAHRLEDSRGPSAIRATGVAEAPIAPVASFSCGPSIVMFCQDSLGKKIGNGQCADLAAQALKNIGVPVRAGADWPGAGITSGGSRWPGSKRVFLASKAPGSWRTWKRATSCNSTTRSSRVSTIRTRGFIGWWRGITRRSWKAWIPPVKRSPFCIRTGIIGRLSAGRHCISME